MQRGEVKTEYTCSQAANPSASLGSAAEPLSAVSMLARVDRAIQLTNATSIKRKTGSSNRWFAHIVAFLRYDHSKIVRGCQFQSEPKGGFAFKELCGLTSKLFDAVRLQLVRARL